MGVFTNTRRIVKAGFVNFWRNAVVSLSAIFVMVVALFFVGSTMLISVFLDGAIDAVNKKVDINIYFNPDASEQDIFVMKRQLESLAEVATVEYISRDQAIQNFKDRHENDYLMTQALEELVDNPLGAILNVKAKDPSQYEAIAKHIQVGEDTVTPAGGSRLVYNVNYAKSKVVIDKLNSITTGVKRVSAALLLVLIVIAIVITFNTIRLAIYISREEIAIMRLVGANNSFVRGPFVVEGIMYGVVAALVATALFYPATLWLRDATGGFYGGVDLFDYYLRHLNEIIAILMLSGIGLGAISSYLAVRRYLRA
ncbi:MAG TPA: permease-like cell division protein FtsX [Candidatus Paceibacterota bacterium]|nr:permease-like cell division protein FtsX [Candidatus Paceibacterota bacterium]